MQKLWVFALAGSLLAFIGFRIFEETSSSADDPMGSTESGRTALVVDTEHPQLHIFQSTLELLGELQPYQQVKVTPRVGGYLEQITVQRSDSVKRGDLLAAIDAAGIEQQIRQASAAVTVAQAGVARDEAALENIRLQVRRNRQLGAKGLIAQQDVDEAQNRLRSAEATLQLSKAQVVQAQASLSELTIQQEQTRVYAPLVASLPNGWSMRARLSIRIPRLFPSWISAGSR